MGFSSDQVIDGVKHGTTASEVVSWILSQPTAAPAPAPGPAPAPSAAPAGFSDALQSNYYCQGYTIVTRMNGNSYGDYAFRFALQASRLSNGIQLKIIGAYASGTVTRCSHTAGVKSMRPNDHGGFIFKLDPPRARGVCMDSGRDADDVTFSDFELENGVITTVVSVTGYINLGMFLGRWHFKTSKELSIRLDLDGEGWRAVQIYQ
jgi:hypothetical protein